MLKPHFAAAAELLTGVDGRPFLTVFRFLVLAVSYGKSCGTPGRVRTCDLRFRRPFWGFSINSFVHAPLSDNPHGYRAAKGSLIRPPCPLSATVSIQLPTIYPQATHKQGIPPKNGRGGSPNRRVHRQGSGRKSRSPHADVQRLDWVTTWSWMLSEGWWSATLGGGGMQN